jgi:hypothetical protein
MTGMEKTSMYNRENLRKLRKMDRLTPELREPTI